MGLEARLRDPGLFSEDPMFGVMANRFRSWSCSCLWLAVVFAYPGAKEASAQPSSSARPANSPAKPGKSSDPRNPAPASASTSTPSAQPSPSAPASASTSTPTLTPPATPNNTPPSTPSSPASPPPSESARPSIAPYQQVGAPLPDPPPPLPPHPRDRGVWRGNLRLDAHLIFGGPLGSISRVSGNAFGVGGGIGLSIRPLPWLGLGPAFAVNSHHGSKVTGVPDPWVSVSTARYFDIMALRLFWPNSKRVQPFLSVAGGVLSVDDRQIKGEARYGGQWRAGLGLDAWVARSFNFWAALRYRNLLFKAALPGTNKRMGHRFELCVGVGMHL